MDAHGFDAVTRPFRSSGDRRAAVGLLVAAALARATAARSAGAADRKRCKPRCGSCQRCTKGRCRRSPDGTICGPSGKACVAGRCAFACTGSCGGACNQCPQAFDTRAGYCGADGDKTCDNLLPCADHGGCSSDELCAATACPGVNGITNRCMHLCRA